MHLNLPFPCHPKEVGNPTSSRLGTPILPANASVKIRYYNSVLSSFPKSSCEQAGCCPHSSALRHKYIEVTGNLLMALKKKDVASRRSGGRGEEVGFQIVWVKLRQGLSLLSLYVRLRANL